MFVTRLCDIYERTQIFDPLSFLSGSPETRLKVQDVFTNILIKKYPDDLELDYLDIIKFTQSLGQPASLTFQNTQPPPSQTTQSSPLSKTTQVQQSFQATQSPSPSQSAQSPPPSQSTQSPPPSQSTQSSLLYQSAESSLPSQRTQSPPLPFQITQSPPPPQATQSSSQTTRSSPKHFQTTHFLPPPSQTTMSPLPCQITQSFQTPPQTTQSPPLSQITQSPPSLSQATQSPPLSQTTQSPPSPSQATQSPPLSQTTQSPPSPSQTTQSPPSPSQTTQSTTPSQTAHSPLLSTQPRQLTQSADPQLLMIKGMAGCGKTTLLTFILSEWLKDECDRRIKHLHEYDFVLHILCRESNCVSLEEFLEQVLPQVVAFRPNTQTLLNKCKVLFLIDGIDERNNSSDQLVKDILYRRKLVPESTIVCTSRPEAALDFLHSVPQEYRKGEGLMEGIALNDRTNFVLKYYDCFGGKGSANRNMIGQVMKNVGWRDHFRLPLNLLFLATLFHENSDCVRVNITQTSLYVKIHNWSVEKLHYRFAHRSYIGSTSRLSREESLKKVLDVLYGVALLGLLENRLFLSYQDFRQLQESCNFENLPWEEVMGAFFSLRQTISVNKVVNQTYHVPHKGLQEFFGAKYITNHFDKCPDSKVKTIKYRYQQIVGCLQGHTSKDIRSLLKNPSRTELKKFRNLLLHVAGLLSQPDVISRPRHFKVK
ncbi:Coagulation factor V [Portunus trituberculatus]|uniref:Coagulation factor V n=1 Tax=Portunus trituberculatus TaxID=210409 RepID=A0A5B7FSS9_PORTR|nr:Coagulation factor V [Portunus trituberculatus]